MMLYIIFSSVHTFQVLSLIHGSYNKIDSLLIISVVIYSMLKSHLLMRHCFVVQVKHKHVNKSRVNAPLFCCASQTQTC